MNYTEAVNLMLQGKRCRVPGWKIAGDYCCIQNSEVTFYRDGIKSEKFLGNAYETNLIWEEASVDTVQSIPVGTKFTVPQTNITCIKPDVTYIRINKPGERHYDDFVCFVNLSNGLFHAEPIETAKTIQVKVV